MAPGRRGHPDGARIAYFAERDGNLDIYSAAADGTDEVRLTEDPAADHSPVWSPDGGSIAFVSERDGDQDIVVMDADGSDERDVSGNAVPDDFPAWSPDGGAIAFVSYLGGADPLTIGDGNAEIFVVTPDGTDRRNISRNPAWDGDPAWSPDGTQLVFTRRADHGELYLMAPDGSGQRRLRGCPERRTTVAPRGGRSPERPSRSGPGPRRGPGPITLALCPHEHFRL